MYGYIMYAICTFQVWSHVIDPDVFLYVNVIPLWFPTVDAIPFRQWLRLHVLKCHRGGSKGRCLDTNSSVLAMSGYELKFSKPDMPGG